MLSIFLCLTQSILGQNAKLESAIDRYNKLFKKEENLNTPYSETLKDYAWQCYKLLREYQPNDFEARRSYLTILTDEFEGIDTDYDKKLWCPDAFADSCMLERGLGDEMIYRILAYKEYNKHNDKYFDKLLTLCHTLDRFSRPIVYEILSKTNFVGDKILEYSNDILTAYDRNKVPEEYYIPIYNILLKNTDERAQKLDIALEKLRIFKIIKSKNTDYSTSKSQYLKAFGRDFDRDYAYAFRDVYNFTQYDNYPTRTKRLLDYIDVVGQVYGKNSDEYGEQLQELSEIYQDWCITLGPKIRDVNQDTWLAFNIYNKQYQDWLADNGKFGGQECNIAARQVIFITQYHMKDDEGANKYFWNYVGQVKDKFGEESQQYIQSLKVAGQNIINHSTIDTEINRIKILMLEKDDSDEAKKELAELKAKTGTTGDKIETLKTIKNPTMIQLLQLASNENQYGNIDNAIKYWKMVLDTCCVMSHRADDNRRLADSYATSGLMQLQSIMQSSGQDSEWWQYAQGFIDKYNSANTDFISLLLMVASSCKGDYGSMDYYNDKIDFTLCGDSSRGIKLIDKFLKSLPKLQEDKELYAHILATKADLYCYSQEYEKAQQILDESIKTAKMVKDISPMVLLQYEMYDEVLQAYKQDFDNAIKKALKAKDTFEYNNSADCFEYYSLLFRLQMYYEKIGNHDKVIEYGHLLHNANVYQQRYAITQRFMFHIQGPQGNLNIYYDKRSDLALVNAYYNKQNYNQAYTLAKELIDNTQKSIQDNYSSFTRVKQKNLMPWVEFLNTYTPLFAYRMPQYDWAQQCYDAALIYKQFSLSADNALKRIVLSSDDKRLIDKYNELNSTRQLFDTADEQQLDSLSRRVSQLESQLLVDVKRYGDVGSQMQVHAVDIRNALQANAAAIEFICCDEDDGNCHYLANVIVRGQIKNYYLCTEQDLINSKDPYTTNSGYNQLWLPLEEDLYDIEDIYFSAVGALHQIPIEYFAINNKGTLLSDKYRVHRLSSTREIVTKYPETQSDQAVLYGGIEYELAIKNSNSADVKANVPEVDTTRGGFSYLPGTKEEVANIEKELKSRQYNVTLYEGENGSEESFKSLSSKPLKYLHIATHGFFTPKGRRSKFDKLFKGVKRYSTLEDANMTRSGLLMAGALNSINGKPKSGVEDGVLTSKEISSLDFTHLELVVLSACETALGEIGSEGVYGLQRAFKKAGAQSMIMSLRKVDDDATKILMSSFYRNLSEIDKLSAFRKAVKELREVDGGKYDASEYWTSFILIDD